MTPRVLFVGAGKGSWLMRGCQMAEALGARATTQPTSDDWAWADIVVLVKRAVDTWGEVARETGRPLVWDVLDYWQQPEQNATPVLAIAEQIAAVRRRYRIRTVIGATRQMAEVIGGVYIPHQCRLGLAPTPPRSEATTVAYDGQVKYLGPWKAAIEAACARLSVRFVVNPPSLSEADVLVAFRGGVWDGPLCRQWKSGVKYVNAIAAGRPILTEACAAHEELVPPGLTVDSPARLEPALAQLLTREQRALAYAHGLRRASQFTAAAIAGQYRDLCRTVLRRAA